MFKSFKRKNKSFVRKIAVKRFEKKFKFFITKFEKDTGKQAIKNNNLTEKFIHWLREKNYRNK